MRALGMVQETGRQWTEDRVGIPFSGVRSPDLKDFPFGSSKADFGGTDARLPKDWRADIYREFYRRSRGPS
jgi:hypothetical protein